MEESRIMIDYSYIQEVLKEAGDIMKQHLKSCDIYVKGRADFVTEADIKVQQYIYSKLKEKYAEIGFVGEEATEEKDINNDGTTTKSCCWILDPIDGTTNYIYGYNLSAISLALKENGSIIWGAVYNPFTEEMFTACKGKGAYLNGVVIKASKKDQLADSLVAVGTSPYYKDMAEDVFGKITEIFKVALDIRRTGSAALDLAYVACGRQEAYFEYNLKLWDYAAGAIILEEAGGVVCNAKGNSLVYDGGSDIVACCNEKINAEMMNILNK